MDSTDLYDRFQDDMVDLTDDQFRKRYGKSKGEMWAEITKPKREATPCSR